MAYAQIRKDFEYLETIAELDDCVEVDAQVFDLMKNPTKAQATSLYETCVGLWFDENRMHRGDKMNRRTRAIAKRHGHLY